MAVEAHWRGADLPVTVSAGVAVFPEDAHDPETLYQRAEAANRAAKESGRNRVVDGG